MTTSFDLGGRPAIVSGRGTLDYRPRASLPFDVAKLPANAPLLLDSSVHVDSMHRRVPPHLQAEMTTRDLLHSAVVVAELTWGLSLLDPTHPNTQQNRMSIEGVLHQIMMVPVATPDPQTWVDAAMLAATLSRRQTFDKDHRRKALNDALIFYQARQAGAVLVTRNIRDFDLMDQIVPGTQLLFYDRAAA